MQKTVMISGASRGIGLAISQKLFREGWNVSLGVRDEKRLKNDWLEADPERILFCHYDALNPDTAKFWLKQTLQKWQTLDALVNCAGILKTTPWLDEESDAELLQLFQINTVAPLQLTRTCFEALKVSGAGRVINVISMSGLRVKGKMAGYPMSKHAMMAFHNSLRHVGYDFGIRATAICPGYTNTDMVKGFSPQEPAQMTQPADIANVIYVILQLPNSSGVSVVPMNSLKEDLY